METGSPRIHRPRALKASPWYALGQRKVFWTLSSMRTKNSSCFLVIFCGVFFSNFTTRFTREAFIVRRRGKYSTSYFGTEFFRCNHGTITGSEVQIERNFQSCKKLTTGGVDTMVRRRRHEARGRVQHQGS